MVRFIMQGQQVEGIFYTAFTFQYGQIYYKMAKWKYYGNGYIYIPIWLDLLSAKFNINQAEVLTFTFQYGQIYYIYRLRNKKKLEIIYIPIWLDLL